MKDGRNIIIAALLVAVLVMSVGYAAFASQLKLDEGRAEIVGDWQVEITKIEATNIVGQADAGTYSNTISTASFDADLKQPGDAVTYTVTVENKGSIDARLDNATFTEQVDGSSAIIYTTTNPGETLAAGASTTFTVTVTYDSTVTEVPEVTSKTITAIIDYVQA